MVCPLSREGEGAPVAEGILPGFVQVDCGAVAAERTRGTVFVPPEPPPNTVVDLDVPCYDPSVSGSENLTPSAVTIHGLILLSHSPVHQSLPAGVSGEPGSTRNITRYIAVVGQAIEPTHASMSARDITGAQKHPHRQHRKRRWPQPVNAPLLLSAQRRCPGSARRGFGRTRDRTTPPLDQYRSPPEFGSVTGHRFMLPIKLWCKKRPKIASRRGHNAHAF
jgi:hypothetical protein